MAPMGPRGPNGKWLLARAGVRHGTKIHVARAPGSFKIEVYKNSGYLSLNYEPRVILDAEFDSGIGNGWKTDENMKNNEF